jgi:GntR family transcriptional regulator/MocR family aminotransferase
MPRTRTSSSLELLLPIDRSASEPLHRQLEHGLRDAIRGGRLGPGATLPSTRSLAEQLGTSRGIVVEAYEQLVAEGYLSSRPGGATHVASGGGSASAHEPPVTTPPYDLDFRPGRPDVGQFPRASWLRSLRHVLAQAPNDRLSYVDGRGLLELRAALAAYLDRVRGTSTDPADLVVCTGFTQALRLVAQVLAEGGARVVATEDPGQPEARMVIRAAGLRVLPLPVDAEGLQVDRLERERVDAVLVTPAHQYPTGAVLSPARRAALVAWAARTGGLVVEDDYDAEYRYDREPIGAVQGLAPERVVYIGSASKTLAPGLRLGWLKAPNRLVDAIALAKGLADQGSPTIDQLAFADFLSRGELDRHLRRMRPMYRARRDMLLSAIDRELPDFRPVGASAGLHILAWLPPGVEEVALVEAARTDGIRLAGLTTRGFERPGPGGIIFGYGSVDEGSIDRGVGRIAGLVAALDGRDPR